MRCSLSKTALVFLLIFSISYSQIAPSFAGAKGKKVQVAFIGVTCEDIPPDIQDRILERVTDILKEEPSLSLIEPEKVQQAIGGEKAAEFLSQPDSAAFVALAEQLQVDYVFAGVLSNNSRDPNKVLLVGQLNRFDAATKLIHRFEVLKYYDNFGVELVKFKQEFVKSIVPVGEAEKNRMALYVLGGVAVVGIVALTIAGFKGTKGGQRGDNTPTRP
jgi:hypothetical protein